MSFFFSCSLPFKNSLLFYLYVYGVLPTSVSAYSAQGGQKRALDLKELELQMIVS